MLKLTTDKDKQEALHGLSATAELLVAILHLQASKLPNIGSFFGATVYKRWLSCMQLLAFLVAQGVLYLENTSCNCPPPRLRP